MQNILLPFITGLSSGGISCLAVQGGLLTSSITDTNNKKINSFQIFVFLLSKLAIYTLLGFILGFIGSVFFISPKVQAIIQIIIGVFLLGTAGRLLNIHPIFRYFAIKPPKNLFNLARKGSRIENGFAPAVAGALTILLPCGVTQAMMLTSVATGSPILGAATMFSFVLGTSPVFFAVGLTALEMLKKRAFSYLAATFIAIFGLISLNSASALLGSNHTFQNYLRVLKRSESSEQKTAEINSLGIQEVSVFVKNGGYSTGTKTLKAGVPVRLKLITDQTYSCSRAFTIPSLGISKILPPSGEEIIEFTPQKAGKLNFTCSMGMYSGSFDVIK